MAEPSSNLLFDLWNKLEGVFCSAASSSCPLVVPKLTQLHDMVYEVYTPPPEEKPELEIVFFHGLKLKHSNEAHITTWMSQDNFQLWPQTWLVEAFPKVRILTVSYDCAAKKTNDAGRLDMFLTRENLLSALTSDSTRVGETQCPIVLVGHCLGGLLLKELCLHANMMLSEKREEMPGMHRIHDFFYNLRGMFFYGTPHIGSLLVEKLPECFNGSLLTELEIFDAWSARKNGSFCDLKSRYKWVTYGMGETRETFVDCLGKYILVVPEASSRESMDRYYSVDANHSNICKPVGKQASSFSFLRDFLQQIHEKYVLQSGVAADALSGRGYVVDFHDRAEKVKRMLAQPDLHTTFIVGLTGMGKTTLAQQVFHDVSHTFAIRCFIHLDNFQGNSSSREEVLRKIQSALKQQVKGWNYDHFQVPHYLKGKKVLIMLDNVQSQSQLDALGREIWLEGSNSRLVVTTTYPRLGSASNTYEVEFLSYQESRELFCHYAFQNRARPKRWGYSLEQVINRCGNFPLSVEILSRYLSGEDVNDENLWRDLLVKLENAEEIASGPDYRLWARLSPCYYALAPSEQELFLDVAVVFCDLPVNFVECIWSACRPSPSVGWTNLKRGFLVKGDHPHDRIWMHDLLRNLGRSIACPRSNSVDKWRRISAGPFERDFIAKYQGVMETLSLQLEVQANERLILKNTTLAQYVKLEYLILDGAEMKEGTVELPRSLVYLKWRGALFEACPVDFNQLENLAILDLQYCKAMKSLPSSVVKVKKLAWLELGGCQSLTELPEGLFELSDLEYLDVSMTGLTEISSKVGKLKKLRYFQGNHTQVARIPDSVGRLRMMQILNISNTAVSVLPESIGNLSHLTTLNANNTSLSSLPDSIGDLQNLKILCLDRTRMKGLPDSLGNAAKLEVLLLGSTPLETLPDSLCKLRSLKELALADTRVSTLPDGFEELEKLSTLSLEGSKVRSLADIGKKQPYLTYFSFTTSTVLNDADRSGAGALSTISNRQQDFGGLLNFEFFLHGDELEGRESGEVQDEGETRTLAPSFPFLKNPYNRDSLTISGQGCNQSLPPTLFHTLKKMTSLENLTLEFLNEVETLPSELGMLTSLIHLEIRSCEKLRELPESLGLLKLNKLRLVNLPRLRILPKCKIPFLDVFECGSLRSMRSSFGHTAPLERDSLTSCGHECTTSDSSPTLDDELPWRMKTDSWKLVRCSLACYKGRGQSVIINFDLKCEEMERVRKKAVEWQSEKYRRQYKVTTTVLRKLCSESQAGDDGEDVIFGPSTVWLPLNDVSRTALVLQCGKLRDKFGYCHWCNIHELEQVRVLDVEDDTDETTEEDSEQEEVEEDAEDIADGIDEVEKDGARGEIFRARLRSPLSSSPVCWVFVPLVGLLALAATWLL